MIVGLTIVNIFGVNVSKFVNNLITISKLVPLALFIAIGIFFINGANFTPVFPQDTYVDGSFAQAAVLLFFAYTGFEVIAIAAEDMKNPKKEFTTCYYHVYASRVRSIYGNPRRIYRCTRL